MSTYEPMPIDTSQVQLSLSQRHLVESLAENAHDVWAKKRIDDGWRFGAARDDEKRTHPSLVPYADLPETEKDYDRVMVEEVVKAALARGYRIIGPAEA